jgi:hypothetical protein
MNEDQAEQVIELLRMILVEMERMRKAIQDQ